MESKEFPSSQEKSKRLLNIWSLNQMPVSFWEMFQAGMTFWDFFSENGLFWAFSIVLHQFLGEGGREDERGDDFFANFVWQMTTTKHFMEEDIGIFKTVQNIQVVGRQLKVGDLINPHMDTWKNHWLSMQVFSVFSEHPIWFHTRSFCPAQQMHRGRHKKEDLPSLKERLFSAKRMQRGCQKF